MISLLITRLLLLELAGSFATQKRNQASSACFAASVNVNEHSQWWLVFSAHFEPRNSFQIKKVGSTHGPLEKWEVKWNSQPQKPKNINHSGWHFFIRPRRFLVPLGCVFSFPGPTPSSRFTFSQPPFPNVSLLLFFLQFNDISKCRFVSRSMTDYDELPARFKKAWRNMINVRDYQTISRTLVIFTVLMFRKIECSFSSFPSFPQPSFLFSHYVSLFFRQN